VQPFLLDDRGFSFSKQLGWSAAVFALIALGGIGLAVVAIRTEDEDSTWSPAVARAALLLGAVALVFALVAVIGVLVTDTPRIPGFTAPSP
jgi:peptidoglycan/LPS O-acetylase OafA/YrhL